VIVEDVNKVVPTDPFTFGYVEVGIIQQAHGVKGEVKVKLSTDFMDLRMQSGTQLYAKKPNRRTPRPITVRLSRKQLNNIYLVSFQDIRSRFMASALVGYTLYVKKENRPVLGDDEYLVRDLVGLECRLNSSHIDNMAGYNMILGHVNGIVMPDDLCEGINTIELMHAMIELKKINSDELCLIPFVPQIVTSIDLNNKVVIINPPIGLLDLTYTEMKRIVIRGYLPETAIGLSDVERMELERYCIFISALPKIEI
jgi:16S rRNA processing protein RimM